MSSIEKQTIELTCPGCRRAINATYYDICTRREVKCRYCSSKYKFSSSGTSPLRTALNELARAQEKIEKHLTKALQSAAIELKR